MKRLGLSVFLLAAATGTAFADWQLYRKDKAVVASFDILSFASFRHQPSVWVRWHYVTPRKGVAGIKIHFTANCSKHRLYEIATLPYDTDGNYLADNEHPDTPREYPLRHNSLNKATYELLCR
ncbi:hypothetical protein [Geobacter sp.]|uniref:hypothetical protein n=1 Tax=Geobacter sp. TaxID=46610 RepID=UPI00263675D0|nr:hypothetical protein [Geobacter sp.]